MNLLIILIGSCLGSFFTLIAERSTIGLSIIHPSSHCTHCQTKLQAFDLIPILSYLSLKGKCRYCHKKISNLSTLTEILTSLILLGIYQTNHLNMSYLPEIVISFTSILLSLTDIICLSITPFIFFTGYGLSLLMYLTPYYHTNLHIYTALLLYSTCSITYYFFKDKIGLGDIKIICFWSLILNFYLLLQLIFYASFTALIYYFYIRFKKVALTKIKIPFVPFLTLGYILIFIQ